MAAARTLAVLRVGLLMTKWCGDVGGRLRGKLIGLGGKGGRLELCVCVCVFC